MASQAHKKFKNMKTLTESFQEEEKKQRDVAFRRARGGRRIIISWWIFLTTTRHHSSWIHCASWDSSMSDVQVQGESERLSSWQRLTDETLRNADQHRVDVLSTSAFSQRNKTRERVSDTPGVEGGGVNLHNLHFNSIIYAFLCKYYILEWCQRNDKHSLCEISGVSRSTISKLNYLPAKFSSLSWRFHFSHKFFYVSCLCLPKWEAPSLLMSHSSPRSAPS